MSPVLLVSFQRLQGESLGLAQAVRSYWKPPLRLMAASLQWVRICLVRTLVVMIHLSSPGAFGFFYTLCHVDLLHKNEVQLALLHAVGFLHNFSLSVGNGLMRTVSPDCRSTNSLVPLL